MIALLFGLLPQVPQLEATVGMPAQHRDLVLPGSELEVAPATPDATLVLRMLAARPHGDAWRYDIDVYGLDPGEHDLRTALRRRDGSSTEDLPALPFTVRSVLAEGLVKPNPLESERLPGFGGYRTLGLVLGGAWVAGLGWILLHGRGRRRAAAAARPRAATLAERLRPLVEAARAGTLAGEERARLEMLLIAFWRRRLGLEERGVAAALAELRAHPEAGTLLKSLEDWLHRPDPPEAVDLDALLAPYRAVHAEEVEPARG